MSQKSDKSQLNTPTTKPNSKSGLTNDLSREKTPQSPPKQQTAPLTPAQSPPKRREETLPPIQSPPQNLPKSPLEIKSPENLPKSSRENLPESPREILPKSPPENLPRSSQENLPKSSRENLPKSSQGDFPGSSQEILPKSPPEKSMLLKSPPITSPPNKINEIQKPSPDISHNDLFPPTSISPPSALPKQQKINASLHETIKDDNGILPRRKSRMPFGERLSLVQYNNPEPAPPEEEQEVLDPVEELKKIANCSLPPIEPEKQLRCIMDCVLPPRKREIDGQSWLERASTVPSTRLDILGLQQRFENELNVRHAKSFGICPIRRQIYDELFDEIIRQVTINCAERGLLLLRVRDEIHLSMLSYQTLLESSIGYGIRKAILFEQQQSQALMDRDLEKAKNVELNKRVEELEKQLRQEAITREEEIKLLEATMKDENERLLESNRTLKMHLQAILQMDQQLQVQQATLNDVGTKEN